MTKVLRALSLCCGLLSQCFGFAQSPAPLPVPYKSINGINYVRTWTPIAPVAAPSNLTTSTPVTVARMTTEYADGLGRTFQIVQKQGSLITDPVNPTSSTNAKDLVQTVLYDEFGRESIRYLPFVSSGLESSSSISNGLFKLNPYQQQVSFYNNELVEQEGEIVAGTQTLNWAYSKTEFEASPLNRVNTSYSQGSSWVGNNRGIQLKYWFNTTSDSVRIWKVNNGTNEGDWGSYSVIGIYPAGELNKRVIINENGHQVIEFTDKEGLMIMKKVQNTATSESTGSGSGHVGWLNTYYIYDVRQRLRAVLQPEGVKFLLETNNWDLTSSNNGEILKEQAFRYEYDAPGRVIRKKIPGAADVYLVYDKRNRLVLTQDAQLRALSPTKWQYTKYDNQNRVISTGLWDNNQERLTHATAASVSEDYPSLTSGTFEELTRTFYDNYEWLGSNSSMAYSTIDHSHFVNSSQFPHPDPVTQSLQVQGLQTGSIVKVIGENTTLQKVYYYDSKGRLIQTQRSNYSGGTDIVSTQYTYSGLPLIMVDRHVKLGVGGLTNITVTENVYDELLRLSQVKKKNQNTLINPNSFSDSKILSSIHYDALGRTKKKILGNKKDINGTYTSAPLETITNEYNIRGWLLGANRSFALRTTETGNYFGFDLGYDKTDIKFGSDNIGSYASPTYNGNLSGIVWKSKGDLEIRRYQFSYDPSNRLTAANFTQNTGGAAWSNSTVDFSVENLNYDYNGNILTIKQWGLKLQGKEIIDNLTYSYFSNSNKVRSITDAQTVAQGLGDFTDRNLSTDDYGYDVNGNLITDRKRFEGASTATGLDLQSPGGIKYNYLNLPTEITVKNDDGVTEKGKVEFVYDATGQKLKKIVKEGGVVKSTTSYFSNSVYKDDLLLFVNNEEGRMRYVPSSGNNPPRFEYDYFLKDHLGNVRMVLTEEKKQDVYYPATLEGSLTTDGSPNAVFKEKEIYNIESGNILSKSLVIADYPNHNGAPPYNYNPNSVANANSQKVYRLRASAITGEGATGLGVTLKVMGGDKIDIFGQSYWIDQGVGYEYSIPTSNILSGLIGSPNSPASGKGSVAAMSGVTAITNPIGTFLSNNDRSSGTAPKAFINWILFDENFRMITGGFDKVNESGSQRKAHTIVGINVPKNGYLYVYASNESTVAAYFDNLQVIHTRDHILEENHYYPFGLSMHAISSSAGKIVSNNYQFNGNEIQKNEFTDHSSLDVIDFNARMYDPQLGRYWQTDPLAEYMRRWSPYNFAFNNPARYNDQSGLSPIDTVATPSEVCLSCKDVDLEPVTVEASRKKKSGLGWLHTTLDIIGVFDPFGIADAANAIIYVAEGNYVEAGISLISVIPGGDLLKTVKYADEAEEVVEAVVKHADEIQEVVEKHLDEVVPIIKTERKKSAKQHRKEWEEAEGKKWPKEPENANKNQEAHHPTPLADGGKDGYPNITPLPRKEHRKHHKENGDFSRWGKRGKPKKS